MNCVRSSAWALTGAALLASAASALEASAESGSAALSTSDPLRLRLPQGGAVYLRALTIDVGSTEEEVLAALVRCKREPLPERCDESTFENESPLHRETVGAFWMARTEVTVADYQRCVRVGRCGPAGLERGARRFRAPAYPVTLVTFEDAKRYCAFRGGRLPTEAEFERAARGAARRAYAWGQQYNARLANHGRLGVDMADASDGFTELAPVGSFPDGATPEGILDLAGNVAEWTADPYRPTYGAATTGERAVRGGHFESAAPFLRGAARAGRPPETREPTLGFRCVWPVKPVSD